MRVTAGTVLIVASALALASCSSGEPELTAEHIDFTLSYESAELGQALDLAASLEVPARDVAQDVPVVVILHGLGGAKTDAVVEATAAALVDAGIAALSFDFAAHGSSQGRMEDMTIPGWVDQARLAYEYAESLPWAAEVCLAGHSQGGLTALLLAAEPDIEPCAVTVFAPAVVIPQALSSGSMFGQSFDPSDPPATLDLGWVTLGREYILTGQELDPVAAALASYAPLSIVQGEEDFVVPLAPVEEFAAAVPGAQLVVLPGLDHSFEPEPEAAADAAVAAILDALGKG